MNKYEITFNNTLGFTDSETVEANSAAEAREVVKAARKEGEVGDIYTVRGERLLDGGEIKKLRDIDAAITRSLADQLPALTALGVDAMFAYQDELIDQGVDPSHIRAALR